jgi:hypothetical protein
MNHLTDIINTDCYIQFDTNQQLRDFLKSNPYMEVITYSNVYEDATIIRCYANRTPRLLIVGITLDTVYHHSQII